ncbi:MAG TPA: hypothetical protein VF345_10900 [Chthoniobacterales bacterium]
MRTPKRAGVLRKQKLDHALNLSELAFLSGFNRGTLACMMLPLIKGKIFYTDFRRILSARQDAQELTVKPFIITPTPAAPRHAVCSAAEPSMTEMAERLRIPRWPRSR